MTGSPTRHDAVSTSFPGVFGAQSARASRLAMGKKLHNAARRQTAGINFQASSEPVEPLEELFRDTVREFAPAE